MDTKQQTMDFFGKAYQEATTTREKAVAMVEAYMRHGDYKAPYKTCVNIAFASLKKTLDELPDDSMLPGTREDMELVLEELLAMRSGTS